MKKLLYLPINLIIIFFALIFFGCSDKDDITPCPEFEISSLSFNYSGLLNGTFNVNGESPGIYQLPEDTEYVMAVNFYRYFIDITSLLPIGYEKNHRLHLNFEDKGTGIYPIYGNGTFGSGSSISFNNDNDRETNYRFISGEINITYSDCERIIGTFSGQAKNYPILGTDTLRIDSGKFNVKVYYD